MADVIQIETNRLYLGWYEQVENPTPEQLVRWEGAIRDFQRDHPGLGVDLARKLKEYVKTLPWTAQYAWKRTP